VGGTLVSSVGGAMPLVCMRMGSFDDIA
jgi:hypothetical protein